MHCRPPRPGTIRGQNLPTEPRPECQAPTIAQGKARSTLPDQRCLLCATSHQLALPQDEPVASACSTRSLPNSPLQLFAGEQGKPARGLKNDELSSLVDARPLSYVSRKDETTHVPVPRRQATPRSNTWTTPALLGYGFFRKTSRRPMSVRSGSCTVMVRDSGTTIGASPPVATTAETLPSSAVIRATKPST